MRLAPTILACAAAAGLLVGPAQAHDIWLTLSSGAAVPQIHVHYGHPDDLQMPQVDKVVALEASTGAGPRPVTAALVPGRSEPVLVSEPVPGLRAAIVSARYDNGFWVKMPDGQYRNTTRRFAGAGSSSSEAITSVKFAKLVTGPGAPWAAPVGHELEIVPLADPFGARGSGTLPVQVLFRGEPVANASVTRSDGETPTAQDKLPVFRTDASGTVSIPVEKTRGTVLSVTRRVAPSTLPTLADADTYSATLAFTLDDPRTQ